MRRHTRNIFRIVALFVALARVGRAQEMRGTVRDSASGQPIAGAVLTLLDASGAPLGRNITDQRGQYRIALSGGMARVRIVRIGFRPRDVRIPEPVGGIARLDISMVTIPTLLEPVLVSDDSRCSRRADRAAALGLWEQARAGLLATVVARDLAPASVVRLTYERTMDAAGDKIVSQRVALDTASRQAKPFVAAHTGADFARRGFAEYLAGEWWFYAPDADVLLDEAFARTYCFHLMDRDRSRPGQIGLGFLPASRPRNRIDVDGALWIDTLTRALSDIDFRYTGLDRDIDRYRPGGRVAFRAMTNGLVMIDRWALRIVGTRIDTVGRARNGSPLMYTRFDVYETGGEVARAWWPDGTLWKASLGELRLHATTHAHTPATGARLQLNGTTYKATVDANGDIEIPDLLPGPYSVVIDEPTLAPIRLTLKTGLDFTAARDSMSRFELELPTVRDFVVSECRAQRQPTNGPAMILARVMTPDSVPVGQVRWLIRRLGDQSRMAKDAPILETELLSRGLTAQSGLITYCGKNKTEPSIGSSAEIRVSDEKVDPMMIEVLLKDTVSVVPIIWPHPVRRPRD